LEREVNETWTTVTHTSRRKKKSSNKQQLNRSSSSLYRNSSNGKEENQKNSCQETQTQKVFNDITKCMQCMEAQNRFYTHLVKSLPHDFPIREIVCYGIGNFSTSFSPSMLQFSCVLLLQRYLSHRTELHTPTEDENIPTDVPIYFFEPQMTPIERMTIQHNWPKVFIVPNNEYGKRPATLPTLFFMPHCPMRLYCNVLYANWESLQNVLVLGNSFAMYDERRIRFPKDDDTNGIWSILPFCKEYDVAKDCVKLGGVRDEDEEVLKYLENAFNDCALMSFELNRNTLLNLKRPQEYFHQEGDELF